MFSLQISYTDWDKNWKLKNKNDFYFKSGMIKNSTQRNKSVSRIENVIIPHCSYIVFQHLRNAFKYNLFWIHITIISCLHYIPQHNFFIDNRVSTFQRFTIFNSFFPQCLLWKSGNLLNCFIVSIFNLLNMYSNNSLNNEKSHNIPLSINKWIIKCKKKKNILENDHCGFIFLNFK